MIIINRKLLSYREITFPIKLNQNVQKKPYRFCYQQNQKAYARQVLTILSNLYCHYNISIVKDTSIISVFTL